MLNNTKCNATIICRIVAIYLRKNQRNVSYMIPQRCLYVGFGYNKLCAEPSKRRLSSVLDHEPGGLETSSKETDPSLADLQTMTDDICKELYATTTNDVLRQIACYYFDGEGKAIRPRICCLAARAVNIHVAPSGNSGELLDSQRRVAMISEMIHTASLIHDDVIDLSRMRRGKPSVCHTWGEKRAVITGNFILAVASAMLARIGNNDVTQILSQVIADLVHGEFMQLGSKEHENERFAHYLQKTFKKTASLMAHSCKAVSVLAGAKATIVEAMFQYGRNVGMAFQLVDDILDFSASCSSQLGKPVSADLSLGLATAPVLFACQQFPELNAMVMRRFSSDGDVQHALKCVRQSDGLRRTRSLAVTHCDEAVRHVLSAVNTPSVPRGMLVQLATRLPTRVK